MLKDASIKEFSKDFQGQIIVPADEGYEDVRRGFNGFYDKHPAVIARCMKASDVVQAINFARAHKVKLAVRGGGHDYAGNSVCEGGLVVDLSPMNKVQVNPKSKTAQVEGGATCGELDARAQEFGLATTLGTASSIGVG